MTRTRVKICGITRPEDADAAVAAGADALGFVFWSRSKRYVAPTTAARIIAALPPFVTSVALFVDADEAYLSSTLETVRPDLVQFHGEEPPQTCARVGWPYVKAIRMRDDADIEAAAARYGAARALLLDAYQPGLPGGTGVQFDWERIPRALAGRIILAGGLHAGNVARAVREVQPFAVDVSGGVERAPGVKDANRIASFIAEVSRAATFERTA